MTSPTWPDLTFYPYLAMPATWTCIPGDREDPPIPDTWIWSPHPLSPIDATLDDLNHMIAAGWQYLADVNVIGRHRALLALTGQLGHTRAVHIAGSSNTYQVWASQEDLTQAEKVPVVLAFTIPDDLAAQAEVVSPIGDKYIRTLSILDVLPPPQLGTVALIDTAAEGAQGMRRYTIDDLGEDAQALQQQLAEALRTLAGGDLGWIPVTSDYDTIARGNYGRAKAHLQQLILSHRDKATREHLHGEIARLDAAQARYQAIRTARHRPSREQWLEAWQGVRHMAQLLATHYYAMYLTRLRAAAELLAAEASKAKAKASQVASPRAQSLPALTSGHRTMIPSSNASRALAQSFGPGVQPSLWNEAGGTLELQTPNNSLIRLDGRDANETAALRRYVAQERGVEGLKHTFGILDAYHVQTGGKAQKEDARISLRQALLRIGMPESHVDDPAQQLKLMQTILYLSRSGIITDETRYRRDSEPRRPLSTQRRGRKYRERKVYSPLLVIENVEFEEDGQMRIPLEVKFHLGEDFYELLFGEHAQYFSVPTAQLLSYHSDREQHELLLGFYLCDLITLNEGRFGIHFPTLMTQSALRTPEELAHGHDRIRDAIRAVMALEHLERDGIHCREPHAELDTILLAELAEGKCSEREIAPATLARMRQSPGYASLRRGDPAILRERRRKAVQKLLRADDGGAANIIFSAGPLLKEQAAKRAAQRQAAQARDERAMQARVVKAAIPQVIDAMVQGAKPRQKGRGKSRRRDQ